MNCDEQKKQQFLGILPKWYKYLDFAPDATTKRCEVMLGGFRNQTTGVFNLNAFLPVGLAIFEMILHLAAVVAVGYVVYGAFKYITSQGEPENTKNARETILNALIGLAIVAISSSVVAFIGNKLG